jgi:hypothetical protein
MWLCVGVLTKPNTMQVEPQIDPHELGGRNPVASPVAPMLMNKDENSQLSAMRTDPIQCINLTIPRIRLNEDTEP